MRTHFDNEKRYWQAVARMRQLDSSAAVWNDSNPVRKETRHERILAPDIGELDTESLLSDKARKRIRALERLRKHLGRVRFAAWLTASQKKNFEER